MTIHRQAISAAVLLCGVSIIPAQSADLIVSGNDGKFGRGAFGSPKDFEEYLQYDFDRLYKEGETFPMTLTFEKAAPRVVTVEVTKIGAMGPAQRAHMEGGAMDHDHMMDHGAMGHDARSGGK